MIDVYVPDEYRIYSQIPEDVAVIHDGVVAGYETLNMLHEEYKRYLIATYSYWAAYFKACPDYRLFMDSDNDAT